MKTFKFLIPALLVLSLVHAPAHAGFFEWLFGGGKENHKSFRACAHAVFKRDNHRGQLDRSYIVAQCKKFVGNAEDECEMGRLLDVKHGHEYSCTDHEVPAFFPNPGRYFDFCWDQMVCE